MQIDSKTLIKCIVSSKIVYHLYLYFYEIQSNTTINSKVIQMGNDQPKKLAKATKGQIDIACLKAKIHLELCRDRKNADVIKGEKELVNKIRSKSRNKVEEILIAQRVVNGLKYAQACNLLMSCATSLRGHALFLSDNQDKPQKMEPWLPFIYSLIYGADHLGLSSLNQFKAVLKALNDPVAVPKYTNPEIMQLLTASPTPEELNIYIVQMSERNAIPLEQINMVGHKFTTDFQLPPTQQELEMQKQLGDAMKKNFEGGWNPGNNGHGGQSGFGGQGGQGGFNGGFNGGQGGFNGGQGGFNGGQGGFNGGQGGFNGGFNLPPPNPYGNNQPPINNVNPYISGKSNLDIGPNFHMTNTLHNNNQQQQKPHEFTSYEDLIGLKQDPKVQPIYPSIDPTKVSVNSYKPPENNAKGVSNPFQRNSIVDLNNKGEPTNSPTISQILRDFK